MSVHAQEVVAQVSHVFTHHGRHVFFPTQEQHESKTFSSLSFSFASSLAMFLLLWHVSKIFFHLPSCLFFLYPRSWRGGACWAGVHRYPHCPSGSTIIMSALQAYPESCCSRFIRRGRFNNPVRKAFPPPLSHAAVVSPNYQHNVTNGSTIIIGKYEVGS